jgi:hypothetical protein
MISALGLFFESAALSRHYGLSIDTYYLLSRLVTDEVLEGLRDGAYRVAAGQFDGKLTSIDLTIAGMQEVCRTDSLALIATISHSRFTVVPITAIGFISWTAGKYLRRGAHDDLRNWHFSLRRKNKRLDRDRR